MATLYTQNCSPDPPPSHFKAIFFHAPPPKSQESPYLIKNEHLLGNQQHLD